MSSGSDSDNSINDHNHSFDIIPREITLKFIIVGDYGVGKTAIVRQYAEGRFSSNYKMTIGADFSIKTVVWDSNTHLNVQLWDIAGHEIFGAMTRVYYKFATAAVVVFDVSRIETFHSVHKWLHDLRYKVTLSDGSPIPAIIMANKCDITGSTVPTDDLDNLCREWNIEKWYLTSAKDNINIGEAMKFLITSAMENKMIETPSTDDQVKLETKDDVHVKHKACCI